MTMIRKLGSISTSLALAGSLLLATGCRGPWSEDWKFKDMFDVNMTPWSKDEPKVETPRRIVDAWTDTVLHQAGKTPQRGFGGRLIFYGKKEEQPVLVDGQLVIYAFDETNRASTDNKPTRRYVFPADQMVRHLSKSGAGPSYSVWLPWDEVGGPQKEVSLIARFEPKKGPIVVGEQTRHILPGETNSPIGIVNGSTAQLPAGIPAAPTSPSQALAALQAQQSAATHPVQLASYDATSGQPQTQPAQLTPSEQQRMSITSISLPENFRIPAEATPAAAPIANASPTGSPALNMVQGVPQPTQQLASAYPNFITPQQLPPGNVVVAPGGFAQQPPPATVARAALPPRAALLNGQPPMMTASAWPTVNYAPAVPQAAVTTAVVPSPQAPPSSGYPPQAPPAPATPAFR
jgi:hypothetical protein